MVLMLVNSVQTHSIPAACRGGRNAIIGLRRGRLPEEHVAFTDLAPAPTDDHDDAPTHATSRNARADATGRAGGLRIAGDAWGDPGVRWCCSSMAADRLAMPGKAPASPSAPPVTTRSPSMLAVTAIPIGPPTALRPGRDGEDLECVIAALGVGGRSWSVHRWAAVRASSPRARITSMPRR